MNSLSTYLEWNNKLACHFFRPEMAGKPVYLYVTDTLIEEIGKEWQAGVEEFVHAVRSGPPIGQGGICERALKVHRDWRRRCQYPPYLGYLSLFSLAAGWGGDFSANAYYPRLRTLLGEKPNTGQYPNFHLMGRLWDDLELWSCEDRHGDLGNFHVRRVGSWVHVGIPIAQAVLTQEERKALPNVFSTAGLDPLMSYGDAELSRVIRQSKTAELRNRTIQILEEPNKNQEIYPITIDAIREELLDWDGTVVVQNSTTGNAESRAEGHLYLTLKVDEIAGRTTLNLRAHIQQEFPDEGITLQPSKGLGRVPQEVYTCEEDVPSWSTMLRRKSNKNILDAQEIDLTNPFELKTSGLKWRFRFTPRTVYVFTSGASFDLRHWIEATQVERTQPFYLLAPDGYRQQIESWGNSGCNEFRRLAIQQGLPENWHLFYCRGIEDDLQIRALLPVLSSNNSLYISLRNGIRVKSGNSFFNFGLPDITIQGGDGSESVMCNNIVLTPDGNTHIYRLPPDLPSDTKLQIEVHRGTEFLKRETFFAESGFTWLVRQPIQPYSPLGSACDGSGDEICIAGAYCSDMDEVDSRHYAFPPEAFLTGKSYFIGAVPGQITCWPNESLPTEWSPVWIVSMRRNRGKVIYCGTEYILPAKLSGGKISRKHIKLWREILYVHRKVVTPPRHPGQGDLWRQYQKAAEHAK